MPSIGSNVLPRSKAASTLLTVIEPVDAMSDPTGVADPDRSASILDTLNSGVISVQSITSLGLSSIRSNVESGKRIESTTIRIPSITWN